jgi:hypothetical protein
MAKSVSGKLQLVAGVDNEPALEFSELANMAGSACRARRQRSCVGWEGAKRRAHHSITFVVLMVGTRSLSSGAHSRDPVALPIVQSYARACDPISEKSAIRATDELPIESKACLQSFDGV